MGLCEKCRYYRKEYDEFRQEFNDEVIIGENTTPHFCVMYDDNIPPKIFNDGADCEYYEPKEST